jgi:ADP-heptose:LPS heptosyltransferase
VQPPSDQAFRSTPDRPVAVALRALKLGDLLVAVPALHALRRGLPEHRLLLATSAWLAPLVDLVPVDGIVPTKGLDALLPFRPGEVDVAVNLHGNGAESRGIVDALGARQVIQHARPGEPGLAWQDGIHERVRWARLVDAFGMPSDPEEVAIAVPSVPSPAPGAAVVHVGAFYGSRQWPVDRFAAVARALTDRGHAVVFSGSAAERERALAVAAAGGFAEESVLAGRIELDGFAALVAAASLVVTADTGAAHLASAYRVPSVVIFGPAPPEEWGPPAGGPHIVLTDPALRVGDTFGSEPDPALLAVAVTDVLAAVERLGRGQPPERLGDR